MIWKITDLKTNGVEANTRAVYRKLRRQGTVMKCDYQSLKQYHSVVHYVRV